MNKTAIRLVAVAAMAGLGIAGCSSNKSSTGSSTSNTPSTSTPATSGGGASSAPAAATGSVGVILPDTQSSTRWETADKPALTKAFADAGNARYFIPSGKPDHALFDLNLYTVDRLGRAGITAAQLGRCTYAEEDLFYSYRRVTHRGEPDYGRQISAIVLEEV